MGKTDLSHLTSDQATRHIRRLAHALHMAFMVTFISTLPSSMQGSVIDKLASGCIIDAKDTDLYQQYNSFIERGIKENVVFAAHHEMMTHCDEVAGIAFAERLGGPDGYNLLLALVKTTLPFSFLNGSSSYALFATQLLHHHYKAGPFCKMLKSSLFTSPHKQSKINFALDAQREMDHQDITRSFPSSSTVSSVVPKMARFPGA